MNKLIFFFFLSVVFYSPKIVGQTPFWTQTNGPQAGTLRDVSIDSAGRVIVWTSGSGVYRSSDNGNSWHLLNSGLPNLNMKFGAAGKSGYLFGGNEDAFKQLFRFDENAPDGHWEEITNPLDGFVMIYDILADPDGTLYIATAKGIERSDDNGTTWARKNVNFSDSLIHKKGDSTALYLAIDGKGDLFAASLGGKIFRSTNKGDTWIPLPVRNPHDRNISALAAAPSGNIIIGNFGIVFQGNLYGGVMYVSSNMGVSWDSVYARPANTDEGKNHIDKIVHVPGSNTLFANAHGITLISLDQGLTWTVTDSEKRGDEPFSMAVRGNNVFQMSEPDGIFLSNDNGLHWTVKNQGLLAEFMWGLSINSKQKLFGITEYGLHRSVDNGDTWDVAPEYGETYYPSLYIDHTDQIFIGTDKGLFKSTDDGETLNHVLIGLDTNGFNTIIQVGESPWGKHYLSSRLLDVQFAYSIDGGDHWDDKVPGFPPLETAEAFAFAHDSLLVATGSRSFYLSVDQGKTFLPEITGNFGGASQLLIHPDGSFIALVTNGGGGVFRSRDGAHTWAQIFPPEGLGGRFNTYFSMMIDHSGRIIVCTDSGIYRSAEGNPNFTDWSSVSTGMTANDFPNHYINASDVVENTFSHIFFAASRGLGVFKSIPNLGVSQKNIGASSSDQLCTYPNPSSGVVNISFDVPSRGEVILGLTDVLGRKVKSIFNGVLDTGQNSVSFDGSTLPGGSYMLLMQEGSLTYSSWVTLTK